MAVRSGTSPYLCHDFLSLDYRKHYQIICDHRKFPETHISIIRLECPDMGPEGSPSGRKGGGVISAPPGGGHTWSIVCECLCVCVCVCFGPCVTTIIRRHFGSRERSARRDPSIPSPLKEYGDGGSRCFDSFLVVRLLFLFGTSPRRGVLLAPPFRAWRLGPVVCGVRGGCFSRLPHGHVGLFAVAT